MATASAAASQIEPDPGFTQKSITSTSKLKCIFNSKHIVCHRPVLLKCRPNNQHEQMEPYAAACLQCLSRQVFALVSLKTQFLESKLYQLLLLLLSDIYQGGLHGQISMSGVRRRAPKRVGSGDERAKRDGRGGLRG